MRGDNLWDLSQTYLGNAFLWPEIYRLNRDVVEDPHWIYPGEILRLPGGDSAVVVAVVPNLPALPTETQSTTTTMNLPVDPSSSTVFSRIRMRQTTRTGRPSRILARRSCRRLSRSARIWA